MVAAVSISTAPYDPPTRLDCNAVQQAVVEKSTKYSLGWHGGDKEAFLASAKTLPHQAHDEHLGLPQVLLDVVEFVCGKQA